MYDQCRVKEVRDDSPPPVCIVLREREIYSHPLQLQRCKSAAEHPQNSNEDNRTQLLLEFVM
jgi:hypothetical protein